MSTQVGVVHDLSPQAQVGDFSPVSPVRLFVWSIRRELWENRSLYLAPILVATLILVGFIFGPFGLRGLNDVGSMESARARMAMVVPYVLASGLIMLVSLFVSFFYALDALYAERRDRSILFWKSLPVSDLVTVLAKLSIPLFVVPVITFLVIVTTHLIMAVSSSVMLLKLGVPVRPLWLELAPLHRWFELLFHLLSVSALWYAPFYAWCLLVSAWARRSPVLWALLPPAALSVLERLVFHTSHLGDSLRTRFAHVSMPNIAVRPGVDSSSPSSLSTIGFGASELWLGLVVACLLVAAAVQLRRYRGAL